MPLRIEVLAVHTFYQPLKVDTHQPKPQDFIACHTERNTLNKCISDRYS
ncbi:MAG TPA: hypothetical protein IGS40_19040 [Trichormus sp. M33_DOE_039]|nr:hypothetical protein [Trichormus sp. M33_DOE_039]